MDMPNSQSLLYYKHKRERERERTQNVITQRQTDRDGETDRQTNRDRNRDSQTDKDTERERKLGMGRINQSNRLIDFKCSGEDKTTFARSPMDRRSRRDF